MDFVILSEAKDLLWAFRERGSRFFEPSAAPSPKRLWRVGDLRMTT